MIYFARTAPLLVLFCASSLAAQELREVGYRWFASATYDRARERVVMPDRSGYSYEWDGTSWSRTPDAGSMSGPCYMDHASNRLISVIADGWGVGQSFRFRQRVGHDWLPMPVSGGPADRWGVGVSYDEDRGELVAFGGYDGTNGVPLIGTWTFDGVSWTQHAPMTSPSARYFPSMCYDSARQRTVLFGGVGASTLNDTWEWDGSNWAAVTTATTPPSGYSGVLAFDSARAVSMLVGASAASPALDLWEYDGVDWTLRNGPPLPVGSGPGAIVFDEARAETLLIGSSDSAGWSGSVFAWDGSQWSARPGLGGMPWLSGSAGVSADPAGNSVLRISSVFNGQTGATPALASWDGNSWQTLAVGGVPARQYPVMWSMASDTFLFGGLDATNTTNNDTWRWDGATWTQVMTAVSPPPRMESAIAFHPTQNHALLFGGSATSNLYGAVGGTWRFDGSNWQQLTTGPQPGARRGHGMAYDPVRDRVVLYGGQALSQFPGGSTQYFDTWEHDGVNWVQVSGPSASGPTTPCSLAFDSGRQAIVAIASTVNRFRMWEFDGLTWTLLSVAGDETSEYPVSCVEPVVVAAPSGRLSVSAFDSMFELLPNSSSAQAYGTACTATAPHLTASELPDLGRPGFGLEATLCPTNSFVAILGANQAANVSALGCTLLVTPGVSTSLLASNAQGYARQGLPLPNTAALLGSSYYFQAATFDVAAPAGITFSRGLRVTLGE